MLMVMFKLAWLKYFMVTWLVADLPLWKKYEFVSWDYEIPNWMGKNKYMFQATNQNGDVQISMVKIYHSDLTM